MTGKEENEGGYRPRIICPLCGKETKDTIGYDD